MNKNTRFKINSINIEPNSHTGTWEHEDKNGECIYIYEDIIAYGFSCTLEEAKYISKFFNEIIEHYDNMPESKVQINSIVEILEGRFKGCKGIVTDVDKGDNERPLIIHIEANNKFTDCHCFENYDNVRVIEDDSCDKLNIKIEILDEVKNVVSNNLGIDINNIESEDTLKSLEASLLDFVEIIVALKDSLDIEITYNELMQLGLECNIYQLAEFIHLKNKLKSLTS